MPGRRASPLLRMALFRVRTFRISLAGGFLTRLGRGGLPFLLPLLCQVGLGMPTAVAAIGMKFLAARLPARFGYRPVLIVNTVMIGLVISLYALVNTTTPVTALITIGVSLGFFNSLQFTSMNSMAYADIGPPDTSMASTIASSLQQMSRSFGLAWGSLIAGWYLGSLPQTDHLAVTTALHHALLTLAGLTILSSLSFHALRASDGESISRGRLREA